MSRCAILFGWLAVGSACAFAQPPLAPAGGGAALPSATAASQQPIDTAVGLLKSLERFFGLGPLSMPPATTKDGDGTPLTGDVWVVNLEGREQRLTSSRDFSSPLYQEGRPNSLLALQSGAVVRIGADGRATRVVWAQDVKRLVAVDRRQPDAVLVVTSRADRPLAILSLADGGYTPLPFDAADVLHRQQLAYAHGDRRDYGAVRVFVVSSSEETILGMVETRNVYLQQGGARPRPLTACVRGTKCQQPTWSADASQVAYLRVVGE